MLQNPLDPAAWAPVTKAAIIAGALQLGGAAISGASEGSILESASQWDTAVGDMVGISTPADAAAVEQSLSAQTLTGSTGGSTLAESTTGLSSDAGQMLVADAGPTGTMTDVSAGYLQGNSTPDDAVWRQVTQDRAGSSVAETGAMDQFGSASYPNGSGGGTIMDYTSPTPTLTDRLATTYGKVLDSPQALTMATIGGAGLLFSSASGVANRANALEQIEKRTQAQKDLQRGELQNAIELEEWRRQHTQSGSYFDARIPFRPKPGAVLRRPGGSPVYASNGLLNSGA